MLSRDRKAGRYLKNEVPTTFLFGPECPLVYLFSSVPGRDLAIPRESDVHAKAATSHITSKQINGVFILSRAKQSCCTSWLGIRLAASERCSRGSFPLPSWDVSDNCI